LKTHHQPHQVRLMAPNGRSVPLQRPSRGWATAGSSGYAAPLLPLSTLMMQARWKVVGVRPAVSPAQPEGGLAADATALAHSGSRSCPPRQLTSPASASENLLWPQSASRYPYASLSPLAATIPAHTRTAALVFEGCYLYGHGLGREAVPANIGPMHSCFLAGTHIVALPVCAV